MASDGSLRASAIKLALAGGIEYGLQLAMPIILVRCLDAHTFGQYRFLWLLANSALAIAPAFMPQSLFYFLPRTQDMGSKDRAIVIGNVLLYVFAAALMVGVVVSGWNPLLPAAARSLFSDTHGVSTLFLILWVIVSMYDVLPTADGRARWQAGSTVTIAIFRTVLLGVAAWFGRDIAWVVAAMLMVALIKLAFLAHYIWRQDASQKIGCSTKVLKAQLAYALPFAVGNALFLMRGQADQWVAASMFEPALYAVFSISVVLQPVGNLIRQPVYNAMMPRLNAAYAIGDTPQIIRLITGSNGATAFMLLPIAGGFFVVAHELVAIIYTTRFAQTAPIMQVYLVGMMINSFAVGHVLPALDKGRFAVINNAVSLPIAVFLSIAGVHYFGLIGAAFGSVLALAMSELWSANTVAASLKINLVKLLSLPALWPMVFGTGLAIVGIEFVMPLLKLDWHGFAMLFVKAIAYLIILIGGFLLMGGRKQFALLSGFRKASQA
jgi:O-antigen/teichoic acid export membrane protein